MIGNFVNPITPALLVKVSAVKKNWKLLLFDNTNFILTLFTLIEKKKLQFYAIFSLFIVEQAYLRLPVLHVRPQISFLRLGVQRF